MAEAQNVPLTLEAGEYRGFRTTVLDPAGQVIQDLTSYTARIRFSGPAGQDGKLPAATLELTTENEGIQRDGNLFRWAITAEAGRRLKTGVWQMVVINSFGYPTRIYEGRVTVRPEIKAAYVPA